MNHEIQNARDVDSYGLALARHLDEASDQLPYSVSERLRAARVQALSRRSVSAEAASAEVAMAGGGQLAIRWAGARGGWWGRIAAIVPLLALLAGLVVISQVQDDVRARELADIDAELLTDDLPPVAYTDPGFLEFLRSRQVQ